MGFGYAGWLANAFLHLFFIERFVEHLMAERALAATRCVCDTVYPLRRDATDDEKEANRKANVDACFVQCPAYKKCKLEVGKMHIRTYLKKCNIAGEELYQKKFYVL
jgi:hypothetical protein